ncbi:MAG: hypothetical protein GTO51_07020 [Candidatus Latescibacteria bacterium]|nr:hypothetical protein [Candidatus Latescibacterota bacterium]NIM21696.1 hypothetical protein [Candidatus Latescibacterota bacterium]NIM65723.1 hypothetical protein [Candidatus Latescibacterota bacterium]NIO02108.1 hypothetical protein [Candidatus Latescibacterota bacterium]NIO28925.1 hypothetical protein [Candidatus Latescibacterota bacterium]
MSAIKKLNDVYRKAMVLGAAIGGGLLFYVLIVEVLKSQLKPVEPIPGEMSADQSYLDILRLIFYIIAFAQFAVLSFVRGILLRTKASDTVDSLLEKLLRTTIVTLAICEVPALLGLVLFFVGRFYPDFYILFAVSMAMLFFYFPRYNRWKEWIRNKAGADWEVEGYR